MTTDWVEIILPAAAADVDELAAIVTAEVRAAAQGTEIRGDEVVFWVALADTEAALAEARELAARLAAAGGSAQPAQVRAQPAMPESEWRDAWKKYFHTTRISGRIVVVPSWETYRAAADDVVIDLDPGMAFGTGTHASTRLVLGELDRLKGTGFPGAALTSQGQGDQVDAFAFLDVGAGSGILSIAAAKLWPGSRGIAIDNDPIAVAACDENCRHNGIAQRIESSTTPVADIAETFPLVLANIQAHVLLELCDAIAARVAPGGELVLSGLLSPQAEGVAEAYRQRGLTVDDITADADDPQWSRAVLTRR